MESKYLIFLFFAFISMITAQILYNAVSYDKYLKDNYYTLRDHYYQNFTRYYEEYQTTAYSKIILLKDIMVSLSIGTIIIGLYLIYDKIKNPN